MVDDVTPPYPQYFPFGFRRFSKLTFVRSGGTVPPVASPLAFFYQRLIKIIAHHQHAIIAHT